MKYQVIQDGDVFELDLSREGAANYLLSVSEAMASDARRIEKAATAFLHGQVESVDMACSYIDIGIEVEEA